MRILVSFFVAFTSFTETFCCEPRDSFQDEQEERLTSQPTAVSYSFISPVAPSLKSSFSTPTLQPITDDQDITLSHIPLQRVNERIDSNILRNNRLLSQSLLATRSSEIEPIDLTSSSSNPYLKQTYSSMAVGLSGGAPDPDKEEMKKFLKREKWRVDAETYNSYIERFLNRRVFTLSSFYNLRNRFYEQEELDLLIHNFHINLHVPQIDYTQLFIGEGPAIPAAIQNPQVDTENVMRSGRIPKTKQAIDVIYKHLKGQEISDEEMIVELITYLTNLQSSERYLSFERKGKSMNEIDNAFTTLSGHAPGLSHFSIMEDKDYIILDDKTRVSVKTLLTRVWWIITRQYKDHEQEILKESLVKALGQCIEDDKHRVCDVGKTQRIATVLQGYLEGVKIDDYAESSPDPKKFLQGFLLKLESTVIEAMKKTSAEQNAICKNILADALAEAKTCFKDAPELIDKVVSEVKTFLEDNLNFEEKDTPSESSSSSSR